MAPLFSPRYFRLQIFAIWVVLSVLLLFAQWPQILAFQMGDADDNLRIVQIMDWLAGQSWFDVTQYRINPPDGGPMHWSRLVDVPVGALIFILKPVFGLMVASQIAATVVPLITFGVVLWLTAKITDRLFGHQAALLAALAILAIVPVINQLLPMRIDHHGWQIVLFLTCMLALIDGTRPKRAAIMMGIAAAAWIEISVEGLPFVILFLALFSLRWLFPKLGDQKDGSATQFPIALVSTATTAFLLYVATESFRFRSNYCDALSPFHLTGLAAIAAIVAAASLFRWDGNLRVRLTVCAVAGATGIASVLLIAPQCAGDAFSNLDPLVRDYWFDRTPEGLPLWQSGSIRLLQIGAAIAVGLAGFVYLFRVSESVSLRNKLLLLLLFVGSAIVGIYVSRVSVYALCVANIVVAPAVLHIFRASDQKSGLASRMGLKIVGAMMLAPTVVAPMVYSIMQSRSDKGNAASATEDQVRFGKAANCHAKSAIQALGLLGEARIMTGLDVSPSILQHTRLSIVATGHHRNQYAMKDVIQTFTGPPEQAAKIMARRHVEYLVGWDGSPELNYYTLRAPDGFWAKVQAGEDFNWLEPQPMIGPYNVWRLKTNEAVNDR